MPVYMISYDLKFPGRDYPKIEKMIKQLGSCIKPLSSLWFIDTHLSSVQIRDALISAVDINDRILVVPVIRGAAAKNVEQQNWNWIESHLK